MAEIIRPESPLARFALDAPDVTPGVSGIAAWERPFLGHVNVRGDATDARFVAAVDKAIGLALPSAPNTVATGEAGVAFWLGPNEWLLVTPVGREAATAAALREALAGVHAAVTEVGSGQTVIVVRGAAARELLAKDCPFDLHAPSFAPGACAQTRLAKAPILLRPLEGEAMELIVRRSFADYVWTWLVDAGAEYGFRAGREPAPEALARHDERH